MNGQSERGIGNKSPSIVDILRLLSSSKKVIMIVSLLSVISAGLNLVQPQLVTVILEKTQHNIVSAIPPIVALIGAFIASTFVTSLDTYLLLKASEKIVFSVRQDLVKHIFNLPFSELDQSHTGSLISIISSDTSELKRLLTDGLPEVFGTVLVFIGACAGMIVISPIMFLISLLSSLFTVALLVVLSGKLQGFSEGAQAAIGEMTTVATDALMGLKTIRAFNATDREIDKIGKKTEQAYTFGRLISKKQALIQPLGMTLLQLCLMVVLGVGAFEVVNGSMTVEQLVTFAMYLGMMFTPMATLSTTFSSLFRALGAYSRIQAVMKIATEDEVSVSAEPSESELKDSVNGIDIVFNHVDFSYSQSSEDQDDFSLNDINLHIKPGKINAIVGPSGAGKSTVLSLIEAFYKPTNGKILFNGVDISTLGPTRVHSLIGYVEQDAPIYSGSFRANLVMNQNGITDAECWESLNKVNLTQKVKSSSYGLDTPVGERGVLLSGGERQRLALARLLLIQRPIILLDETTSNLDAHNEELITKVIHDSFPNQTIVMVAHRLETIISADQIIVFDKGTIDGLGTHADLIRKNHLYQQLYRNIGKDRPDSIKMMKRMES